MVFSLPWTDEEQEQLGSTLIATRDRALGISDDPFALLSDEEEEKPAPVEETPAEEPPPPVEQSAYTEDAIAASQGQNFEQGMAVIDAYTNALQEKNERAQLIDTGLPVDMVGGSVEAYADPVQMLSASWEDVSRGEPRVNWDGTPYQPVGPSFSAEAEVLGPVPADVRARQEMERDQSPLERLQSAITDIVNDAVSVAAKATEPAWRTAGPLTPQGALGGALQLAAGNEPSIEDLAFGPQIPALLPIQEAAGDFGEYVGKTAGAYTGLGLLPDLIRGEAPGTTGGQFGQFVGEGLVPTRPGEIALEFVPGVGDARGLVTDLLGETGQVALRGGLGRTAMDVAALPGRMFPAGSSDELIEGAAELPMEARRLVAAQASDATGDFMRLQAWNSNGVHIDSPVEYNGLRERVATKVDALRGVEDYRAKKIVSDWDKWASPEMGGTGRVTAAANETQALTPATQAAASSPPPVTPPPATTASPPPRVPPVARAGGSAPPPRPPAPNTAAAFDGIIPGESIPDAAFRQYEGAVETAARQERVNLAEGSTMMRNAGKIPGRADPEVTDLFKALHGEGSVPPNLQAVHDDVRRLLTEEEALTVGFDPSFQLHPDYFPRFWEQPPTTPRPKALGAKPGYVKPRVDATFSDLLNAGYKPKTWDPYEMVALRRMAGAEYREQTKLLEKLKDANLVADVAGPVPDGWRIPDVTGAVFQPKPYKDAAGNIHFTPPKMVPNGVANVLEQMFGRKLNWGTVGKADVHNVVSQVFNAPKRVKLMGSFFQQMDFATRTGFSSMGGAINDLVHGKPLSAVQKVAKLPASVGDLVIANVSPARRLALKRTLSADVPVNQIRPGVTWKMISQQGLGGGDVSAFNKTIQDALVQARPKGVTGAPRRIVNKVNGAMERGLFEGVYPQAQKTAIENFIAPAIMRAHPNWTDAQVAASIATEANKMFSSLPRSQSALRHINRNLTEVARMLYFSTNETEAFLKATGSTFAGPNKEMWAEYWAGGVMFLAALANVIHYATTGEPLPADRMSPVNTEGPLGITYNPRFLAPDVPLKGRGGTKISVDLLGQMDTALRMMDPASFLLARTNVIPRAGINQAMGRDFFGRPLDTTEKRLGQLASDVAFPIPVQNATGFLINRVPGMDKWIAEQEARLGEGTQLAQIPGFNFRAETNQMIRDRLAKESGYPGVTKWDDLLESQQREIQQRPENAGLFGELELRGDEAAATGSTYAQYQQLVRADMEKAKEQALSIDERLKSGAISGPDARREWDALVRQMAQNNDARRQMPEVKAVLDSFGQEKNLTPAQQAQRDYFAIFDAEGVKVEGQLNFDRYKEELAKWQEKYPNLDKTDVSPGTFLSPEHQRQEEASKRLSEAGFWDAQDKAFDLAKKLSTLPDAAPEQKMLSRFDSLDQLRTSIEAELRKQGTPETQIDSSRAKIEAALGLTRLSQAFEDQVIKSNPRLIIDLEEWYGAPKRLREYAAEVTGVR